MCASIAQHGVAKKQNKSCVVTFSIASLRRETNLALGRYGTDLGST